jgi:hypothetical protein
MTDDVFVSKLDGNLTTLIASTFLGATGSDYGNSLALDSAGNVYLTGDTWSNDFPTTPGAYDNTSNGGWQDVFVSLLSGDLSKLFASSFLGGNGYDIGSSLVLGSNGNVYLTGETKSTDFPTTVGAFDRTDHEGLFYDVFVAKLHNSLNTAITVISPNGGESWTVGTSHNITWVSPRTIAKVRIEISTDNGSIWSDVIESTANNGSYAWIIPNTPSATCLIRISDVANANMSDISNSVFSILMSLDLQIERCEVKAFSILREYGRIQFLAGYAGVQAAQYRIMRCMSCMGTTDFLLLKTIAPSELQNNQFQMQDKYLEKDISYTYRVEAYDAAGYLVGISLAKTI